ncbi:MAG: GIY-YIG nuclease family protein [Roseburia sp.]|nr:GIY-YIG nuclease family protein [Roseburia sp.]
MTNYRQIKAIEAKNKQRIQELCPMMHDVSGIYILTRHDSGFKYAYVGQAKHLLTRLAQHLSGYEQHIDRSLKKHKLWSEDNPSGWRIDFMYCPEEKLDEIERQMIADYANRGFQLRNKTAGGQDGGKFGIAENRPAKGYRDGLQQGYENARKEIKHLFDKYLSAVITANKLTKNAEKALQKFNDFLNGGIAQ